MTDDAPVVLAHAVGIRSDLPVSLWLVLTAATVAVVVSFAGVGVLWRTPKLHGGTAGRQLPDAVAGVLTSPVLLWLGRALVLLASAFVVAVALVGPEETSFNFSPYAFYITFWVGLVPVSLLFGPVWRVLNPLRTLYAGLARFTGPAPGSAGLDRLGCYPAAGFMLAFAWLELVYPDRSLPRNLGIVLVGFAVVQLIAALWYGSDWFARGDPFEVWSSLLGRMCVLGRRADGKLVVRSPLNGADSTPQLRGLPLFVTIMVGSTAYDGVTRAEWYQNRVYLSGSDIAYPTVALLVTVGLVVALYLLATGLTALISHRSGAHADPGFEATGTLTRTGRPTGVGPGATVTAAVGWRRQIWTSPATYAHSIVPIAAGYAIAHYFSLLMLEGQLTWILASNPFAQDGVDLFGIYRNEVNLTAVSPRTIQAVQIGAIVGGHVLGVVLAHDRAVRLNQNSRAVVLSQLPMLLLMVALTCGGLALILG